MNHSIYQSLDTAREKPIGPFRGSEVFVIQLIASEMLLKKKKNYFYI
jgi:hypothetical protein